MNRPLKLVVSLHMLESDWSLLNVTDAFIQSPSNNTSYGAFTRWMQEIKPED